MDGGIVHNVISVRSCLKMPECEVVEWHVIETWGHVGQVRSCLYAMPINQGILRDHLKSWRRRKRANAEPRMG